MTIRELIERLQEIAETTDDEREIRIAQQPTWPLEATIVAVTDPYEEGAGDIPADDTWNDPTVVWIATSETGEYAPTAAWSGVNAY